MDNYDAMAARRQAAEEELYDDEVEQITSAARWAAVKVACGMCKQFVSVEGTGDCLTQITGGMHIIFSDGYGMFTDRYDKLLEVSICHDCFIKVLSLFPEDFRNEFKGGHPGGLSRGNICDGCEYSWSAGPEKFICTTCGGVTTQLSDGSLIQAPCKKDGTHNEFA